MGHPLQLVVLISGNGSNLQAIIDRIEDGELDARIAAVISNRPEARGLERARRHGIEAVAMDHHRFDSREAFDRQLRQTIGRYRPDLIVLAGYMRILSPELIEAFRGRMLNIHPSLLPKYPGLHTHQRALDAGDSEHGVSIHVVTPELDAGPVLMQGRLPIEPGDTAETLQHKLHALEHRMYPQVLQWIAEGRMQPDATTPSFDGKPLEKPLEYATQTD
jgi:phosphoribosylglycinamide formyltransferase-1